MLELAIELIGAIIGYIIGSAIGAFLAKFVIYKLEIRKYDILDIKIERIEATCKDNYKECYALLGVLIDLIRKSKVLSKEQLEYFFEKLSDTPGINQVLETYAENRTKNTKQNR
ncbi:MAG: hypothetical protein NC253_11145 [Ruminococcus sp.]|nr:hypothetical protein [Ruminococcus sp.]MCM1380297.1 hypothetical protein [Muribaculaceae bacterium]MCM1478277.1 hypothetical protein [Muribaculaceae bacterium]